MCLILFAYKAHPLFKLVIAANRDEFYHRPTKPADFWDDAPHILAGRDLEAGGTWMGINTKGKICMLTNYRDLKSIKADAPSRGHLVSYFLENELKAPDYLTAIADKGHLYNGFNLICGDVEALYYYGNYTDGIHKITPGFHGLSNALLDTRSPKVDRGVRKLELLLDKSQFDSSEIFEALYDDIKAPDNLLPDTGVGSEMESMLSSMFIKSPKYGSRCSTILTIDYKNQVQYLERTYNLTDFTFIDRSYQLSL